MQWMFIWKLITKGSELAIRKKAIAKGFVFTFVMDSLLSATELIYYSYFGSADARVLRYGTYWELTVVVLCGKILTVVNAVIKQKFR